MTQQHVPFDDRLNLLLPHWMKLRLQEIAHAEALRTGYTVDMSSVVRRILASYLEYIKENPNEQEQK